MIYKIPHKLHNLIYPPPWFIQLDEQINPPPQPTAPTAGRAKDASGRNAKKHRHVNDAINTTLITDASQHKIITRNRYDIVEYARQ